MQEASVLWLLGSEAQEGQCCGGCGFGCDQCRDGDSGREGQCRWSESHSITGREGCLLSPVERWCSPLGWDRKSSKGVSEAWAICYSSMHSIPNIPPLPSEKGKRKPHQIRYQSSLKVCFQILCLSFKLFPNILFLDFVVSAQPEFIEHLLYTPHSTQEQSRWRKWSCITYQ